MQPVRVFKGVSHLTRRSHSPTLSPILVGNKIGPKGALTSISTFMIFQNFPVTYLDGIRKQFGNITKPTIFHDFYKSGGCEFQASGYFNHILTSGDLEH